MTNKNRRFAIEKIDNGFLLKITESDSDKFVGRYAYPTVELLLDAINEFLLEE